MAGSVRRIRAGALDQGDRRLYEAALAEAVSGLEECGVPVGAALGRGDEILASGRNRRVQDGDPIAHGEMSCIRRAGRQLTYGDTTLATTLAPCMMCTGTILQFKVPRLIIGEAQTFTGFLDVLTAAGVGIHLLEDPEATALMRRFQNEHPDVWAEDIAES